jgi:hypothetical protein
MICPVVEIRSNKPFTIAPSQPRLRRSCNDSCTRFDGNHLVDGRSRAPTNDLEWFNVIYRKDTGFYDDRPNRCSARIACTITNDIARCHSMYVDDRCNRKPWCLVSLTNAARNSHFPNDDARQVKRDTQRHASTYTFPFAVMGACAVLFGLMCLCKTAASAQSMPMTRRDCERCTVTLFARV